MSRKRDLTAAAILGTLRSSFENIEIVDVMVEKDVDFFGDAILRVDVVFRGTPQETDTQLFSSAVRHIRPKLDDLEETAFPILSFISEKEYASERLQLKMRERIKVISAAAKLKGDIQKAIYWYRNEPIADYDHHTAAELVAEGHADAVLAYIRDLENGARG